MSARPEQTHESFIAAVVAIAVARSELTEEHVALIAGIKLVYGTGPHGTRGVTYYSRWSRGDTGEVSPMVEICAGGESNPVQLAGTTLHELGHVLAVGDGHGSGWKAACALLGLRRARAAGQHYHRADFAPLTRMRLAALELPADGSPVSRLGDDGGLFGVLGMLSVPSRPCGAGIGTKGGKSRGVGSGTRNRKAYCVECGYTIRASAKWLDIGTPLCVCGAGAMRDARDDEN